MARARIYLSLQTGPSEWPDWMRKQPVRTDDGLGPMDKFTCSACGQQHDKLWHIRRVRIDTCGHFPVFRLNGRERVIDGSLPTVVDRLPRDAMAIGQSDAERLWHLDTGSHCFGS